MRGVGRLVDDRDAGEDGIDTGSGHTRPHVLGAHAIDEGPLRGLEGQDDVAADGADDAGSGEARAPLEVVVEPGGTDAHRPSAVPREAPDLWLANESDADVVIGGHPLRHSELELGVEVVVIAESTAPFRLTMASVQWSVPVHTWEMAGP